MYFETWEPAEDGGGRYFLRRAYLHVFRVEGRASEKEILALHCEPEEDDDPDRPNLAVYRRGPHLHVTAAEHPIPKAHLALVAGRVEDVLATASSLTEGLARSIEMIGQEVVDRYATV